MLKAAVLGSSGQFWAAGCSGGIPWVALGDFFGVFIEQSRWQFQVKESPRMRHRHFGQKEKHKRSHLLAGRGRSAERWLSREHAFSGADRGYSGKLRTQFATPTREASPTVPHAPFASRASSWSILEPRSSSHEHRFVITFSLARRYRTMQRHAFVPVAH